jgi:hypothetical protein
MSRLIVIALTKSLTLWGFTVIILNIPKEIPMVTYRRSIENPSLQWIVHYSNKAKSVLMEKQNALNTMKIYKDAVYIEKLFGWFGKGKKIYRNDKSK